MSKRFVCMAAVFVVCMGSTYAVLKPNPKKQAIKVLCHLERNEYCEAEEVLNALVPTPAMPPTALYRGYLEQARQRLDKADMHFQTALSTAKAQHNNALLIEILLGKATNAYLEGRVQDLLRHIAAIHNLPPLEATDPKLLF